MYCMKQTNRGCNHVILKRHRTTEVVSNPSAAFSHSHIRCELPQTKLLCYDIASWNYMVSVKSKKKKSLARASKSEERIFGSWKIRNHVNPRRIMKRVVISNREVVELHWEEIFPGPNENTWIVIRRSGTYIVCNLALIWLEVFVDLVGGFC